MSNLPQIPEDVRENLLEKLKALEIEKAKSINKRYLALFLIIVLIGLISLFSSVFIIPIIAFLFFTIIRLLMSFTFVKRRFKNEVINEILQYLLPTVKYSPYSKLTASNLRGSRILGMNVEKIRGDDLFQGTRGKTSFKFSEIKFSGVHKNVSSEFSFNKFHGVLIKCKCEIPIEKSLRIFSINSKGSMKHDNMQPINLEEGAYYKKFKAFGFDNVHYGAIINSRFLERLWSIKEMFGGDLYVSIFPKSAHVFVEINHDFFEPNLKEKLSMNQVNRIYKEIIMCLMVVDVIDEVNIASKKATKSGTKKVPENLKYR